MQFSLVSCDRLGVPYGELTQASLDSVTWDLLGDGALKLSIDPITRNADKVILNATEVQLWMEDSLEWWGVPRKCSGDLRRLTFDCEELFSYFHYRFVLDEDLSYTDLEQFAIGRNLVNYAQSGIQGTNPNLHISIAGYTNSGVTRSRDYISDRKHNIFDALKEFTTLDDGYEQSIEVYGDGRREWTPWYPQKGTDRTDIVLEYGHNIVGGNYSEDGTKMATKIDATGGTTPNDPFNVLLGREKQRYTYEDVAASTTSGVHIAVLPSGSRSDLPWLQARATGQVNARKAPVVIPTVICRQGGKYPQLVGNVKTGDLVRCRIDRGRIQVNGTYRIKTMGWQPKGNLVPITFTSVIEGT